MLLRNTYYLLKPAIPTRLRMALRRIRARRRAACANVSSRDTVGIGLAYAPRF